MNKEKINQLGDELYDALRTQETLQPLTEREPEITIDDAYHISLRMVSNRVERDGEKIVGKSFHMARLRPIESFVTISI